MATATGDANAMNTHPVVAGMSAAWASSTPFRHTDTVFVPVSAATRYHHSPPTVPAHEKFTRWAVSIAYCDPIAMLDGGTWDGV